MSVSDYHIEKGYVFSVGNVEVDGTYITNPSVIWERRKDRPGSSYRA